VVEVLVALVVVTAVVDDVDLDPVVEVAFAFAAAELVDARMIPPPHPQQTDLASSPSTPSNAMSSAESLPSPTSLQTPNSR
jgi:hypothetical protein